MFPTDLGDLGWSHIPGAWAGLGSKAGLSWDWGYWERCEQVSPPWTCSAGCPLHGTTISRSRQTLWAGRALKTQLVSMSPAGKVPASGLLPYSLPTSRGQHPQPTVASICNKANFPFRQSCLFIGFWVASSRTPLSVTMLLVSSKFYLSFIIKS